MQTSFNIYSYTQYELNKTLFSNKGEALAYGESLDDPRWFLVEETIPDSRDFLVIWRGDEDEYLQSKVELPSILDPRKMTNNDWVKYASVSEGYTEAQSEAMLERGYDLIIVCPFPSEFYET